VGLGGKHTTAPGGKVRSRESAAIVSGAKAMAVANTTKVDTTIDEQKSKLRK